MTPRLDVVVLAGGASRRMGRDKATLELAGERLVDRAVDRMATVAGRVWVARGPRTLGRADELEDVDACSGPLAGILAALRTTEAALLGVVPVDAPHVAPAVVARLAEACARAGRPAAVVTADGHVQALHAVIDTAVTGAVEARVRDGERSPRRLLGWLDALRVDVDGWGDLDPSGALVEDWDRPEDLPSSVRPG